VVRLGSDSFAKREDLLVKSVRDLHHRAHKGD